MRSPNHTKDDHDGGEGTVDEVARQTVEAATIGTPYILNSAQVQEAPERINRPVPVPSIFKDERGEIHNFEIGGRRVNLLFTRAGVMRSGDLHKDPQHDFVFFGKVRVWTLQKSTGETVKTDYSACQYVCIPPYTPHIFEFLTDSLVAEWWDGPFHAWFYEPYRKIVQESFQASRPGRFAHYTITENPNNGGCRVWENPAVWTALAIGLSIGFMVGSRRR